MSDFDVKALRGHLRIATGHVDGAIKAYERLQSDCDRWKQRCKAAEVLIPADIDITKSDAYKKWLKIVNTF